MGKVSCVQVSFMYLPNRLLILLQQLLPNSFVMDTFPPLWNCRYVIESLLLVLHFEESQNKSSKGITRSKDL